MEDGLRSRNRVKVNARHDKFLKKGHRLRSLDNTIKLTINGRDVTVDDLDIFLGDKPYIKIYGDIEFIN